MSQPPRAKYGRQKARFYLDREGEVYKVIIDPPRWQKRLLRRLPE